MMNIFFNKLYKNDRRINSYIALPYRQGVRKEDMCAVVFQNGSAVPCQERVTAIYPDGSVKFSFVRFICELPANKGAVLEVRNMMTCEALKERRKTGLEIIRGDGISCIKNGKIELVLQDYGCSIFESVKTSGKLYEAECFKGPVLKSDERVYSKIRLGSWTVAEEGDVLVRMKTQGEFSDSCFKFEVNVSIAAESESADVSFRLINASEDKHHIKSLVFAVSKEEANYDGLSFEELNRDTIGDSTGCGDLSGTFNVEALYTTTGTAELSKIEKDIILSDRNIRTMVGKSNYKTKFTISGNGTPVQYLVDADYLIGEANEHFAEVFYGTFFADRTDAGGGVCGTVFQAQQNFPKAVRADENGIYLFLVPEDSEKIVMMGGMSREQKFSLLFHDSNMPIEEIDDISLRYQMPDRPYLKPEEFDKAGVFPDIFTYPDNWDEDVEIAIVAKTDDHARAYGMLNFGDAPDPNYTAQGRGNGKLVWSNNEYDYPHACAMQYARTGERRFLDYCIAAASHWMDVDVCHYSNNPLNIGGQWEHTAGHCENGLMVCSHEWVEGLLDYYHFTGDERGLETALGIGDNVLRLLDTPMYQKPGEINARETGWALRSLTALYIETGDDKWISKCDRIVNQFIEWKETYGEWIAPYTDNTLIRTGFMISVAVGSLMRYYREFPSDSLKKLILDAIDDLVENAMLPYGLFYYKELPSLNRLGTNTLLLEAMAIGYELTGNTDYLKAGLKTFQREIRTQPAKAGGAKRHIEDAVIVGNTSPKSFAQTFIPLTTFYVSVLKEKLI